MNQYDELKNLLASAQDDFAKFFEKGNSAAGTRIRKKMQEIKALANNVRASVTEIKSKSKG